MVRENFTGEKYNNKYDISFISRAIKRDIKQVYPQFKVSVKSSRYAGGQSIRVFITDIPYNPFGEQVVKYGSIQKWFNNTVSKNRERYNSWYHRDKEVIEKIANQYNYDKSDVDVDYFNVNYYVSVDLDENSMEKKWLRGK